MLDPTDFYYWNSGHLLENRTRGAWAEWLVFQALGVDPGEFRVEWEPYDLVYEGRTIEVKSAGYVQTWPQNGPSKIIFNIGQRVSDVYIFCLLAEKDKERVEPRDLDQWLFWVAKTTGLPSTKTISLESLKELIGDGCSFGALRKTVNKLLFTLEPQD